jgi:TatD DNase family protein
LGLHPELLAERAAEISLFDEYLPQARYVGEVGVDGGPRFYGSVELQKQVFAHILKSCALAGGRVVSAHSLRAVKIVLDLIEEALPQKPGQHRCRHRSFARVKLARNGRYYPQQSIDAADQLS